MERAVDRLLTYHRQAVFFFAPVAWAYYLPAYMLAAFAHYDTVDTLPNELIATMPPNNAIDAAVPRARLSRLTKEQLDVVMSFINWMGYRHPDDIEFDTRNAIIDELQRVGNEMKT